MATTPTDEQEEARRHEEDYDNQVFFNTSDDEEKHRKTSIGKPTNEPKKKISDTGSISGALPKVAEISLSDEATSPTSSILRHPTVGLESPRRKKSSTYTHEERERRSSTTSTITSTTSTVTSESTRTTPTSSFSRSRASDRRRRQNRSTSEGTGPKKSIDEAIRDLLGPEGQIAAMQPPGAAPRSPVERRTQSAPRSGLTVGLDHLDNLCKLMHQLAGLRDENTRLRKRCSYLDDTRHILKAQNESLMNKVIESERSADKKEVILIPKNTSDSALNIDSDEDVFKKEPSESTYSLHSKVQRSLSVGSVDDQAGVEPSSRQGVSPVKYADKFKKSFKVTRQTVKKVFGKGKKGDQSLHIPEIPGQRRSVGGRGSTPTFEPGGSAKSSDRHVKATSVEPSSHSPSSSQSEQTGVYADDYGGIWMGPPDRQECSTPTNPERLWFEDKDRYNIASVGVSEEFMGKIQEWEEMKTKKEALSKDSSFSERLSDTVANENALSRKRSGTITGPAHLLVSRQITVEQFRQSSDSIGKRLEEMQILSGDEKRKQKSKHHGKDKQAHRIDKELSKLEKEQMRLEEKKLKLEKERMRMAELEAEQEACDADKPLKFVEVGEYKVEVEGISEEFAKKLKEWEVLKSQKHEHHSSHPSIVDTHQLEKSNLSDKARSDAVNVRSRGMSEGNVVIPPTFRQGRVPLPLVMKIQPEILEAPDDVVVHSDQKTFYMKETQTTPKVFADKSVGPPRCMFHFDDSDSLKDRNAMLGESLQQQEELNKSLRESLEHQKQTMNDMKNKFTTELAILKRQLAASNRLESMLGHSKVVADTIMELKRRVDQVEKQCSKDMKQRQAEHQKASAAETESVSDQYTGLNPKLLEYLTKVHTQIHDLKLGIQERNNLIQDMKRHVALQEALQMLLQVDMQRRDYELSLLRRRKRKGCQRRYFTIAGHEFDTKELLPETTMKQALKMPSQSNTSALFDEKFQQMPHGRIDQEPLTTNMDLLEVIKSCCMTVDSPRPGQENNNTQEAAQDSSSRSRPSLSVSNTPTDTTPTRTTGSAVRSHRRRLERQREMETHSVDPTSPRQQRSPHPSGSDTEQSRLGHTSESGSRSASNIISLKTVQSPPPRLPSPEVTRLTRIEVKSRTNQGQPSGGTSQGQGQQREADAPDSRYPWRRPDRHRRPHPFHESDTSASRAGSSYHRDQRDSDGSSVHKDPSGSPSNLGRKDIPVGKITPVQSRSSDVPDNSSFRIRAATYFSPKPYSRTPFISEDYTPDYRSQSHQEPNHRSRPFSGEFFHHGFGHSVDQSRGKAWSPGSVQREPGSYPGTPHRSPHMDARRLPRMEQSFSHDSALRQVGTIHIPEFHHSDSSGEMAPSPTQEYVQSMVRKLSTDLGSPLKSSNVEVTNEGQVKRLTELFKQASEDRASPERHVTTASLSFSPPRRRSPSSSTCSPPEIRKCGDVSERDDIIDRPITRFTVPKEGTVHQRLQELHRVREANESFDEPRFEEHYGERRHRYESKDVKPEMYDRPHTVQTSTSTVTVYPPSGGSRTISFSSTPSSGASVKSSPSIIRAYRSRKGSSSSKPHRSPFEMLAKDTLTLNLETAKMSEASGETKAKAVPVPVRNIPVEGSESPDKKRTRGRFLAFFKPSR